MVGGRAETIGEKSIGGAIEWSDWSLVDQKGIFDEALQRSLWVIADEGLLIEDQAGWALEDVNVTVLAREDAWRASNSMESVVERDTLIVFSGSLSGLFLRSITGSFSRLFAGCLSRCFSRRLAGFFSRGSLTLLDEVIVVATLICLGELESSWAEHDDSTSVGASSEGRRALSEREISVVLANWGWCGLSVALGDITWPIADKN